ncbi:MAG: hypothetical protein ACLR23_15865 [Clostridia bacterium]
MASISRYVQFIVSASEDPSEEKQVHFDREAPKGKGEKESGRLASVRCAIQDRCLKIVNPIIAAIGRMAVTLPSGLTRWSGMASN